jgi:uncharacterized protein with HEPN domain
MRDEEDLAHIENAIREIKVHTAGMNQEAYEADSKTQRAVERNLQIIGDAAHKVSNALKHAHSEIPWDDIYAARNIVVHFYFGVNQKILWDILQEDLDPLLAKVRELLGHSGPP